MKISKFDKANLNELRAAVDAALAPLEAKFNVKLSRAMELSCGSLTERTGRVELRRGVASIVPLIKSRFKKWRKELLALLTSSEF
jgi:hypothetical protein